jgi:hypothetical protein
MISNNINAGLLTAYFICQNKLCTDSIKSSLQFSCNFAVFNASEGSLFPRHLYSSGFYWTPNEQIRVKQMEIVDKIISIKGVKYLNNNDEINIKLYKI